MAADETPPDAGATPDDAGATPPDSGATPDDDMKAKFREALARKQGRHTGGGEGHADAAGKASHTAGPAAHQKEFRRKAGG